MLILFVREYCPYSARVRKECVSLGLTLQERDIEKKREDAQELKKRGGKLVTPYLVDTETQKEMYDSAKIVEYLRETYSNT